MPEPSRRREAHRIRELRPQFRLRAGRDDPVIDWLAAMKPRERSRAIRTALCAYVRERRAQSPKSEDAQLAAALDALFG